MTDPTKKPSAAAVRKRKDAAEEVCWTLMLMVGLGGLDIPRGWRSFLGESLQKWVDLAAEQGQMTEDGYRYSEDEFTALRQKVEDLERHVLRHHTEGETRESR